MKRFFTVLLGLALCACNTSQKEETDKDITIENHARMMKEIFGTPKHTIKSIGILVYDGVNSMDFIGPRYVFGNSGVKPQLIGLKPGPVKSANGLEFTVNTVIDSVKQLDILVIPGGTIATIKAAQNKKLLNWIREIDSNSTYTTSVCTGGWILGATGLLKGKKASTNWYKEEEMLRKFGAIPANERYTQDGKYWTSAGVTAGMDMSLAILADNWGENYAQGVMLDMEYDSKPPISGGSPEKTKKEVRQMMELMYGVMLTPVIDSLKVIHNN
ncbi:MAG: DJ-1/PfpI family protein [Tenacibaculum sp.]|nr:DJ-1/PfpI family protein [Tenacibaculum sp.]